MKVARYLIKAFWEAGRYPKLVQVFTAAKGAMAILSVGTTHEECVLINGFRIVIIIL